MNRSGFGQDLQRNACNDISRIPERHITSVWPARWRIPWHDELVDGDEDCEDNGDVPGPEDRSGQVEAAATPADDVQAYGEEETEEGGWVDLKIGDW